MKKPLIYAGASIVLFSLGLTILNHFSSRDHDVNDGPVLELKSPKSTKDIKL